MIRRTVTLGAVLATGVAFGLGLLLTQGRLRAEPTPTGTASPTTYRCPLHPMVEQDPGPGECLVCGVELVPDTGSATKADERAAGADVASSAEPDPSREIDHWVAPMDPSYVSDQPGKSPMGMDLIPVYVDESSGSEVTIDPVVVQNMGLRIAPVQSRALTRHVRTLGTVDVAENRVSVVNLRYSGWVERIYVDGTGEPVRRGRALFDIYSPELVSAQEEYLLALRTAGPGSPLAASTRRRLELWDLSQAQLRAIEQAGEALRTLTVTAPQSGYVLHKNVVQGARVQAGTDLYRIGDLASIWVNAEVYEFDAPWVRVGQAATMELSFQQGETYAGEVAYIYPTLNLETRTLTVRLEFENPGLALKPGMFATVRIASQSREAAAAVPTEAILPSGQRRLVFVARDLGRYEAREVTTGLVSDDHFTEVTSGLVPGERVVVSGQFLLDSESQLQEAVQKLLAKRLHAKEKRVRPAGGEGHDDGAHGHGGDAKAGGKTDGDTYWTCGMHPQIVQEEPGTCPICGMDLTPKKR